MRRRCRTRRQSETEADPDLALILGDYAAAARGYERLIANGRDDGVQAWAGLVVARAAGGLARAEPRPELLKALYVALSNDPCNEAPSPARLAAWLIPRPRSDGLQDGRRPLSRGHLDHTLGSPSSFHADGLRVLRPELPAHAFEGVCTQPGRFLVSTDGFQVEGVVRCTREAIRVVVAPDPDRPAVGLFRQGERLGRFSGAGRGC